MTSIKSNLSLGYQFRYNKWEKSYLYWETYDKHPEKLLHDWPWNEKNAVTNYATTAN